MIGATPSIFSEIRNEKITPKRVILAIIGLVFPIAISIIFANICGLNVANSDISRALSFKAMMARKSVTNIPNAIIDATWGKLTSVASNWLGGWGL